MAEEKTAVIGAQATSRTIEVSIRGSWVEAPAYSVKGQLIVVKGKWIKIASLHDEEWLETELADPAMCVGRLRECADAPRADILFFSQKVPRIVPRYIYPMEMLSIAVANVASFEEWWRKLPQETRQNVKRAQKRGVTIKVQGFDDEVIQGIVGVQNECPIRQGRPYYHYGKSFEQVKRDHGAFLDRSDFICAYCGTELIGFLKLVYRGDVASILQLNSKIGHRDKRPSNALLAKAVELCEARGIPHLTYGMFNYGKKQDSSLRVFKVRNGFGEMLLPSYYVPLTTWGWLCVKARLYRGVRCIVPPMVMTAALNVRARWYDLRTPRSRCSSLIEKSNSVEQIEQPNQSAGSIS
jgi:hypothetical protein